MFLDNKNVGFLIEYLIEPPAHVLGVSLAPVAPPGVALVGGVGVELPVNISQPGVAQQARHPGALFGQKTRVFLVALPVFQVDGLVRNIDVTAQDELTLLF